MYMKEKIEKIIRRVGHPVAVKGTWDDDTRYYFVRGKSSFLLLDTLSTYDRGTIHLYRHPIKVERDTKHKKFFLQGPRKVSKTLVRPRMDEQTKTIGYANVYKWLLQNKESLG